MLFSVLRRAAGNYGRLALVRRKDEELANTVRWTELFFAPDDVRCGHQLNPFPLAFYNQRKKSVLYKHTVKESIASVVPVGGLRPICLA